MATVTDTPRAGAFIVSEANGGRSREVVTVTATGGALAAGTVLGKITATGKYVRHDDAASDGSETAAAILYAPIGAVEANVTVIARDTVVAGSYLTYEASATALEITEANAELAAVGIIVR